MSGFDTKNQMGLAWYRAALALFFVGVDHTTIFFVVHMLQLLSVSVVTTVSTLHCF